MNRREKFFWFPILGVTVLVALWLAKSTSTKPLTLRVFFDGGYPFDFSRTADAVNAYEMRGAGLPMKVRLLTNAGSPTINVTGFRLRFLPDGTAAARMKPQLPPNVTTQTGCDENDLINSNNRLFIPDLTDIATQMGTTIKSPLDTTASVELSGGGTVSVHQVGGCIEYHDASGMPTKPLPKRAMANGIGGVLFEWPNVADTKVVLERTPQGGGTPQLTDALPNGLNLIVLRVSSFGMPSGTAGSPHVITHFKDHFDGVFNGIDESKRISMYWLGAFLVSPGIDCPFGSF